MRNAISFLVHVFELLSCSFQEKSRVSCKGKTAQKFIHLMRFLLQSLVSRGFLMVWGTLFFFLSFISAYLIVSTYNISTYLLVSFSPSVLIISWFRGSIPSIISLFPLFIIRIFLKEFNQFSIIIFLYPLCVGLVLK